MVDTDCVISMHMERFDAALAEWQAKSLTTVVPETGLNVLRSGRAAPVSSLPGDPRVVPASYFSLLVGLFSKDCSTPSMTCFAGEPWWS